MSLKLDPRTNDPYFDREGNLTFMTSAQEEMLQAFRVWVATQPGMDLNDLEWGFDRLYVIKAPFRRRWGYARAVEVQMEKCVQDLAQFITGIQVNRVEQVDRALEIDIILTSHAGENEAVNVVI